MKYTLGRLGLFVAVAAILLPLRMNIFLTLMIAVVASASLSFFLLRRWRNELAENLVTASARRRTEKEKLRSALAGDEDRPAADEPDQQKD